MEISDYARHAIDNIQELIDSCPAVEVDDIVKMLAVQGYIAQQAAFELIADAQHLDPVKKAKRLVIANQLMTTAKDSLLGSGNLLCRGKKMGVKKVQGCGPGLKLISVPTRHAQEQA